MPGAGDFLSPTYYAQNPEAAFWNKFGLGGTSKKQKFQQGRYGDIRQQYLANAPNNPNLGFQDFLSRFNLDNEFNNLSPIQRGIMMGPQVQYRGRARY